MKKEKYLAPICIPISISVGIGVLSSLSAEGNIDDFIQGSDLTESDTWY